MAPSCWLFWAWWLPLMLAGALADQQAQGCSGSVRRCGNLTISDPFWLARTETGKSCGAPEFQVFCDKNIPSLRSFGNFGFTILNITYEERSLRVIDRAKLELVQASNTCHIATSWNTSVYLGPTFRSSPDNLHLILYNCPWAAAVRGDGVVLTETRIRCRNESKVFVRVSWNYHEMKDYAAEGCDALLVPVLGSSGEPNASDYEQLIGQGFLLTWDGLSPSPPLARYSSGYSLDTSMGVSSSGGPAAAYGYWLQSAADGGSGLLFPGYWVAAC